MTDASEIGRASVCLVSKQSVRGVISFFSYFGSGPGFAPDEFRSIRAFEGKSKEQLKQKQAQKHTRHRATH